MDMHLEGKTAVVTGASKGIGLAVTRALLVEGVRVVAASRTRTPELDHLADSGYVLLHVATDLTEPNAPADVVAQAATTFGGLDILINNLGGPPPGDRLPHAGFLSRTDEHWRAMLDFNLLTAVRACRAAIPLMLDREPAGGAVVNVSSGNGRQPATMNLDYSAAKAALINLTKALSEEFGGRGVRVNGVCPGPTLTPWWTDAGGAGDIIAGFTGSDRDGVIATLAPEMMALTTGRLASAEEVAAAVIFLCSPRSASTTGTELVVDSGFLKAT
jgi:NAD(P)-dependent dehydrogenase (short-subunit alcohol dehydrogenase family)